MEVNKTDLTRCQTALAALKRGKYELDGVELMAVAQAITWLSTLHDKMKTEIETPPAPPPEEPAPKRGRKPKE